MDRFRVHVNVDPEDTRGAARRLRPVSRMAPPRPRWGPLYLALGTAAVTGSALHVLVNDPVLSRIVDAALALVLFATLAGWVHVNRTALTRLGEPDAGAGRPQIRIVRSRHRAPDEPREDDDRVILPYDFR